MVQEEVEIVVTFYSVGIKEQLGKEIEQLKQNKEEQEVRMNALKSQYEGRLLRLDRELRERRETHPDPREEAQDQGGSKVHASVVDRSGPLLQDRD